MVKSKRIEAYAHGTFVYEAKEALKDAAVGYAEKARKELMKEIRNRTLSQQDVQDLIEEVVWCDERPGGIPEDLDTPLVRRHMQRLLLKSFSGK